MMMKRMYVGADHEDSTEKTQISIVTITNLNQALQNPKKGDILFLDIDGTLLFPALNKYGELPQLTESDLVATIHFLKERQIKVVGLTARKHKHVAETVKQLAEVGIKLDEIIFSPNIIQETNIKLQKDQAILNYMQSLPEVKSIKRIYVFDNDKAQLENIARNCQSLDIPIFLKHYEAPQSLLPVPATEENVSLHTLFPLNLSDYTHYKKLGGGTDSVFAIWSDLCTAEKKLVLKLGAHENALKLEMISNAIYELLGVKVPPMRIYRAIPKKLAKALNLTRYNGFFKVCPFIKNDNISPEIKIQLIKETAKSHFVAHVLLGNIDIAKEDNFIIDQDKNIYMIDAGANFIFRSKGDRRKEEPGLVSELNTLRQSTINSLGAKWFNELTENDLRAQFELIQSKLSLIEETVWRLSNELQLSNVIRDEYLRHFSNRVDQLTLRLLPFPQTHAKRDKQAIKNQTAAGVLTYTVKNGQIKILLSERRDHTWSDNFGGGSEDSDHGVVETAMREVAEESNHQIIYLRQELLASPFHDIVTMKGSHQFLYRMYICCYHDVNLKNLTDKEHTNHVWVSLEVLLTAIEKSNHIIVENQQTIELQIKNNKGKNIVLYPPLYQMLQQEPVLINLKRLQQGEKMLLSATLGYAEITAERQLQYHRRLFSLFTSPEQKRQQIADTIMKKNDVLNELKKKFMIRQ